MSAPKSVPDISVTYAHKGPSAVANELVTNCDRFKTLKRSSSLPCAFTEKKLRIGFIPEG